MGWQVSIQSIFLKKANINGDTVHKFENVYRLKWKLLAYLFPTFNWEEKI